MMKWWNSAFNAQGSRVIIVVVQVGTVKIYVAAVEELRKNERQGQNQMKLRLAPKVVQFHFWAFNAQGSRVIIVVVQVGTVKIYVAAVEELRKNERQGQNPDET